MAEIYRGPRAPRNFSDIGMVVLDIDRTVIDTETFERMQWQRALKRAGLLPGLQDPPEIARRKMQRNRERITDAVVNGHGDAERFYKILLGVNTLDSGFAQFHRDMVKDLAHLQYMPPSLLLFFDALAVHKIPTAFFTSRKRDLLDREHCPPLHYYMEDEPHPKIIEAYEAMAAADDVEFLKPHPEGLIKIREYFRAEKGVDVTYENILMVGDMPTDDLSVKALGGMACGLAASNNPNLVRRHYDAGADLIVESMMDLALGAVGATYST